MIKDKINTKIKPYPDLIRAALPALKKLLGISDTQYDEIHNDYSLIYLGDTDSDCCCFFDPVDEGELILAYEDMDVINTICVIEIIGKQYLYTNRKKPFKNPDKVFKSWAKELWEYNDKEKDGTIKYICGKVDMRKYINNGIHLLGISVEEESRNAEKANQQ